MQIYADVTGRPMKISSSAQTCALGAAIAGAVVAGKKAGGYDHYAQAQTAMAGLKPRSFQPDRRAHSIYRELYPLYRTLHDAFGIEQWTGNLHGVMKDLIRIRDWARK
jgi:L-ribulokinase